MDLITLSKNQYTHECKQRIYSLLLMGISPVVIHIENIFHTDDILSLIKLSPSLFPNQEDTIRKKSFLSQAVKSGRKKDEA